VRQPYAAAVHIVSRDLDPVVLPGLRHFLFTWLKTQGIDAALIRPYSGHASRQSLKVYSRLALTDAQTACDQAIGHFPV